MRLHDSALTRLLKLISTDAPAEAVPESRATLRARRAAMQRWHPPGKASDAPDLGTFLAVTSMPS